MLPQFLVLSWILIQIPSPEMVLILDGTSEIIATTVDLHKGHQ